LDTGFKLLVALCALIAVLITALTIANIIGKEPAVTTQQSPVNCPSPEWFTGKEGRV